VLLRWWGSFGWYEINLPWRLVVVASLVLALLGIFALIRWRGRRWRLLLLLWPTAASYAVVVAQATSNYLSTHYVSGLSGRYLFIGFTGVAAVVGAGCGALPPKLARWSPLALLMAAMGMQLESLHRCIDHWWRPIGGTLRQAWTSFSAWSTWPVGVLWTGIGLLVLFAVLSLIALTAVGVRGGGTDVTLPPVDEQATITIPPVDAAEAAEPAETAAPAGATESEAVTSPPAVSAPPAPQPPQQAP
jgi:small subunit ribosomal protein S36